MVIISDVNTPHQWYTIPPSWSCKWQCMWSLALWWFTIFFFLCKLSIFINIVWSYVIVGIFSYQYLFDAKMQEPITNIPFWQKKEMMRKNEEKMLFVVFIYQPKLLFATDVLDRWRSAIGNMQMHSPYVLDLALNVPWLHPLPTLINTWLQSKYDTAFDLRRIKSKK